MLRLDDGESGQLLTPLTAQNLAYQGAPDESTVAPDYATAGGNPVHYIGNTDSLTVALAKMGYAFTSRYGDSIFGALTWQNGSGASFLTGSTCAFAIRPDFNIAGTFTTGSAPFDVVSTRKVSNLNADYLDGFNATKTLSGVSPNQYIDVDGQLIATQSGHGDARDGWLFTKNEAPTQDYMVANKKYVDGASGGIIDHSHAASGSNRGGQLVPGSIFAAGDKTGGGKAMLQNGPHVSSYIALDPNANVLFDLTSLAVGEVRFFPFYWSQPPGPQTNNILYLGAPGAAAYLTYAHYGMYYSYANDSHYMKESFIANQSSGIPSWSEIVDSTFAHAAGWGAINLSVVGNYYQVATNFTAPAVGSVTAYIRVQRMG